jgi:hypothetical protein
MAVSRTGGRPLRPPRLRLSPVNERLLQGKSCHAGAWGGGSTVASDRMGRRWKHRTPSETKSKRRRAHTAVVCSSTRVAGRAELNRQASHSAVDAAGHYQAKERAGSPGAAQEHCGRLGDGRRVMTHNAVLSWTHAVQRRDCRQTTAIAPTAVSTRVEGSGTAGGCPARSA